MSFSNIKIFSNDDSDFLPYLDEFTKEETPDMKIFHSYNLPKFFFENNNEQEDYNQVNAYFDLNPFLPEINNEFYNENKFGIFPRNPSGENNEERKNYFEKKKKKFSKYIKNLLKK